MTRRQYRVLGAAVSLVMLGVFGVVAWAFGPRAAEIVVCVIAIAGLGSIGGEMLADEMERKKRDASPRR